jgi:hypothetical protein
MKRVQSEAHGRDGTYAVRSEMFSDMYRRKTAFHQYERRFGGRTFQVLSRWRESVGTLRATGRRDCSGQAVIFR